MSKHRLVAFYLPQYHPMPENDAFWGKGFTEWHNVASGQPLFAGHYQPHQPAELGYYDLRDITIRQKQAELARAAGLYGFCYYHYWFSGQRPMRGVIDAILASGAPDLPFCLCWANQSWTRNWGSDGATVLLRQTYDEADDARHMRWLLPVFADPRYIKINGKPVFLLYRAHALPRLERTVAQWRAMAKAAGFADLYLCWVGDGATPVGLQANVGFAPRWGALGWPRWPGWRGVTQWARGGGRPSVYGYRQAARRAAAHRPPASVYFPCVTPGFDNSPRRRPAGSTILHGAEPHVYQQWLAHLLRQPPASRDEDLIFINAWNEWAEGCHLEPDLRYGRDFLHATAQALREAHHA